MFAQETGKVWNLSLDTVVVKGNTFSRTVRNRADGSFVWDMQMMDFLPKIMGNADPMHYAQMLPGIQTNNEMRVIFDVFKPVDYDIYRELLRVRG